mmetsp:Transcript_26068/g.43045  ORF Transcript_26068/g.43045 Transcript_26068/m.43045 type:complete len:211 (+) Transcript_26068:419-1051(+)
MLFFETAASKRRCANTDATRDKSRLVARNSVLIESHVRDLQHTFHPRSINTIRLKINQEQVVLSTARHKAVSARCHRIRKRLTVLQYLLLVFNELRRGRLLECCCKCSDGMVVGSPLVPREDRLVDRIFKVIQNLLALFGVPAHSLAVENHCAARTTKRFMCCGRDNVGVLKWRRHNPCRDEPRDVSHVGEEISPNLVCDLTHARVVDVA